MTLDSPDQYEELFKYEKHNAAKATKLAAATVGAGVVLGPIAYMAAPVIGGALGASAIGGGLSGAAATSHGLAMLGGGAIASGGAGMAGGVVVVTAAGVGLGGATGMSVASAYVRQDKSFRIQRLRGGTGTPVMIASGFLTENDDGWGEWHALINRRFPNAPVYRVFWGSSELKDLAAAIATGGAKEWARRATVALGKRASKGAAGPLGLITTPLAAAAVLKNPWFVAKARADMTGAALADILTRCPGQFILAGHSLGGAVMLATAQLLGTRAEEPRLDSVHLLGAAVRTGADWTPASRSVSGEIWNYYSRNDKVLSMAFTAAEVGRRAIGNVGMDSHTHNIHDVDVSSKVVAHSAYLKALSLQ